MPERPRGAGTGWLRVHVYEARAASLGSAWRARVQAPRSASLAARDWNAVCHLRRHGVATPEPLLLLERPRGVLRSDSVLVMRELEGFGPLQDWLGQEVGAQAREFGLEGLGATLAGLFRAGAWLPELALDDLWISGGAAGAGCAAEEIENLQRVVGDAKRHGLVRRRLPSVALLRFAGARLLPRIDATRRRRLVHALFDQARARGARLTDEQAAQVLARAVEQAPA